MKFNVANIPFGQLVRPQIISKSFILHDQEKSNFHAWYEKQKNLNWIETADKIYYPSNFDKTVDQFYSGLSLGDTSNPSDKCYVGKVESCVIFCRNSFLKFNQEAYEEFKTTNKNRYYIRGIGVTLYEDFDRETLTPKNIWNPTNSNLLWVYPLYRLLPVEDIIKYEKLSPGDFILTKKISASVLSNRAVNKPKFYKTSSWTSKRVTIWNFNKNKFVPLSPDKNYSITL